METGAKDRTEVLLSPTISVPGSSRSWCLRAVAVHLGETVNSGHWVTAMFHGEECLHTMSDATLLPTAPATMAQDWQIALYMPLERAHEEAPRMDGYSPTQIASAPASPDLVLDEEALVCWDRSRSTDAEALCLRAADLAQQPASPPIPVGRELQHEPKHETSFELAYTSDWKQKMQLLFAERRITRDHALEVLDKSGMFVSFSWRGDRCRIDR